MTTHSTHTAISVLLALADEQQLAADTFSRELNALRVKTAKHPPGKATYLSDGGGLSLYISEAGAKSWRYRFRLSGQQILTIGTYPEISLEAARRAHRAARYLVVRGEHPRAYVEQKNEQGKLQKSRNANAFRTIAERWMLATAKNLSERTVKHRRAMLEKHVMSRIGDTPIAMLTRKVLQTILSEIDAEAPVTAKHCRGYISQIFEYAEDHELVDANPTPRAKALPNAASRRVVPRKAIAANKIGDFLIAIENAAETDPNTKLALKLLLYTWCRTSEVVGAKWNEVDLENNLWVIDGSRMKARETHTVRLSEQAAAIFIEMNNDADEDAEYVFENRRNSGHMCRMTLTNWRKRHGFADILDMHGLRATASTWANESGQYRSDVIEVALAHKESDRVRAAYNRAEFANELKVLWQDWANFCDEQLRTAIAKKQQNNLKKSKHEK